MAGFVLPDPHPQPPPEPLESISFCSGIIDKYNSTDLLFMIVPFYAQVYARHPMHTYASVGLMIECESRIMHQAGGARVPSTDGRARSNNVVCVNRRIPRQEYLQKDEVMPGNVLDTGSSENIRRNSSDESRRFI